MMMIALIGAACMVAGACLVLLSAVSMIRARDALQMMNVFSPATGMGLPLVILGVFLCLTARDGFSWWQLVLWLLTATALVIVSSLASNVLARGIYRSGHRVAEETTPQDLADPSPGVSKR
jgi:multicomponent Na+:H+ antiporter subunit G